ncbi:polyphosphate:AMP phosphotransferase [Aquabacterium sp. A08]|uniref:polyphosphate:AMP phosphotransferase n=1 Tax=Aquabacterium sp. A08 TaxID=2718532 RepID=UPI00142100A8|nr:polyphosphate:AMP phosphotransferase [Aquabacterium sp. A08]NIC43082.1 polyphosphate:AMP phosphotransferase [Aquabacterium sp. A08]
MFESAEIGHQIDKKTFKREAPVLRAALLEAQYRLLHEAKTAVVILVNGVDGAGRGETVNVLNEWMDPRHIRTEAFGPMTEAERKHPEMWRFWNVLPPKGHIGILFGSWYTDPIVAYAHDRDGHDRFVHRLERIRQFERMLAAEGVVLVKLWFHLSKKAAKARMKELEADPKTAWRVTPQEKEDLKHYDDFIRVSDEALRKTSLGEAPWVVIEGSDAHYRYLTAGRHLLRVLEQHFEQPVDRRKPRPPLSAPLDAPLDRRSLLAAQDYTRRLSRKPYEDELETLQGRLNLLSRDPRMQDRSLVVVFEGMDAAGKGSTIRRITQALDARFYRVVPVAAPNENERAQPYLWRFWRYIPRHGRAVVFDRSWYGRVLVERVEGFCSEADWGRAYGEINEYEEELTEAGVVIVKFWLAITPEEQLRRFQERQDTPHKHYKITDEDWRNRDKWPQYEPAVGDMIDRTSTQVAPWHVVASDDKLWARIEVLRTLCERLEAALGHPAGA